MSRVEESSNQQTQDSMENLLTEDDIGDLAAAVGDGADESDDSLRSDDFLSWLLVHADTINPRLDFDGSDPVANSESSENAPAAATSPASGGGNDGVFTTPPSWQLFSALAEQPDVQQQQQDQQQQEQNQDQRTSPAGSEDVFSAPMETMASSAGPTAVATCSPPSFLTTPGMEGIPPPSDGKAWTSAPTAPGADGGGGKGEPRADMPVAVGNGGMGVGAAGDFSQGQLATAAGIPSDPVLAMQMGARMALSGNLNLIPFGMAGSEVIGGVGDASTAVAAAAATPLLHPVATGVQALASQASPGLPAWTGLPPPPPWSTKVEPVAVSTSPRVAAPKHEEVESISSLAEALDARVAVGGEVVVEGNSSGEGLTPPNGGGGGGIGEKRPRTPSLPSGEGKGGRDTYKDGRRRKRMSFGELEERVKQLSEDNVRLKLHLSNVNDKLKMMASKKKLMEAEIAAKLEAQRSAPSEANKASLAEALSRFKDLYADYGAQRKQEVDFHLKQLERQIVPTDTTKMSLWTLEQDESFFKDRKRGSLSLILRKELGVSEDQIERIQERRTRIKGLLADLTESLRLVKNLQKSSDVKNARFEEVMARLQSSFSPQQVARLLLWVSANRAHISKLPLLPKQMLQQSSLVKQKPS